MTDDDGGLGWEDAYRSPAQREPAAPPPPVRQPRAEEPAPPAAPAWGTPDSAPAKQGPVPVVAPRPAAAPAPGPVTGLFRLLVEQTGGSGDSMRWKLEPEPTHAFPDRDTARAAAVDLCRHFSPQHPFSEQRRRIYRISPDEYLVTVQGMTSLFHFRVSVAEEIG